MSVRVEIEGLDWAKIVSTDCGDEHSVAVTEDGALYAWGAGEFMLGSWQLQGKEPGTGIGCACMDMPEDLVQLEVEAC